MGIASSTAFRLVRPPSAGRCRDRPCGIRAPGDPVARQTKIRGLSARSQQGKSLKYQNSTPTTAPSTQRAAVLLLNLGTPKAPTSDAVRQYLKEFLSDPRVVEIPRAIWWPLLHGVVLRTRPPRSAARYAAIWTDEGSPLLAGSERQARALLAELQRRGLDIDVALAMRYGEPSIDSVLQRLRARGIGRLLLLPMYPQYSATSTASAFDRVFGALQRSRNQPELRALRSFHDHPGYIDALRHSVRSYWDANGWPDRLVMSFHGLPERNKALGDPYDDECRRTGNLLAEALGLEKDRFLVTFQSRFGRARWLQPYTSATLQALGRAGTRRVDVVCPGFAADCLETLEEVNIEGRREFLTAGGRQFHYIGCLNDAPRFVRALARHGEDEE